MAGARPQTPSQGLHNSVPTPNDPTHLSRGYGASANNASHLNVENNDFASTPGNPIDPSPLSQSLQPHPRVGKFDENFDASQRGSSILLDGNMPHRSASTASTLNQGATPSRGGTLKKKGSFRRTGSLKRSGSRRSIHAGSIHGVSIEDSDHASNKENSVFYTPVPTTGTPTEILANRFQAWRKLLKDLITYFREVQTSYEQRAKSLLKVSNVINNTNAPTAFLTEGGLNEANRILRDFHKQSVVEANKARDIEGEVIASLNGLRADLGQKIKEIKSLSGDFKNSVEKEKENTRKAVAVLEEALIAVDTDPSAVTGKGDPYVVRLAVDRQVEKQIDEENYLHRAYLNLEGSGRELESIVVGEIQKAYNALAGILKRNADECYGTIDRLRNGPIAMPRDLEWNQFVENDPHFVNPRVPLRRLEDIEYPGKHHPATAEVRAGMLERKSKYLKSYTPGWYVLSPTHLHEFKSADRIYTQPPVMSLYLPDQKLGSHSQPGGSSHKFMLKGRQTGSMHRGHSWVFRAESYDTMLAWYEDIKNLTEKSGEERNAFVRRHARSISQGSHRSMSSDGGLDEDEADEVPYSANQSMTNEAVREEPPQRPSPVAARRSIMI
ncbi:PH domain protein [Glonium stellatum]|uniref:PH domain protein n=1 Tax=Glonium stellatum TaxID=574774 RepID=A0A8E2EVN5_9PEZI|nr:PH domain protein [Glonium stellatum]